MTSFYMGIDVSKGYADFVILNQQKRPVMENFQLDDTFQGHSQLYEILERFFAEHQKATLYAAVESTGGFENNWYQALTGFQASLPIQTARRYWERKHYTLRGFYRYAISRDFIANSPLPTTVPMMPDRFVPYIYMRDELSRLFKSTASYRKQHRQLEPHTLRTILVLIYGAGLRVSEAGALKLGDVDLSDAIITINNIKFNKTRLVPIGSELNKVRNGHAIKMYIWSTPKHHISLILFEINGLSSEPLRSLMFMAGTRMEDAGINFLKMEK